MSDICFVGIKASQNTYVNQLAVHGSAKLVIEKHVDACKTYRPLYPFFFCSFKSGKFGYALAYFVWKIGGCWKSNVFFEKSLKDGCNFLFEPRSSSVGRALDCTNSRLTVVGSIPGARSILKVLNDNCEMGELPLPCKCLDFHSDDHLKWWSRLLKELNKMASSVFVLNTITVQ